MTVIRRNSQTGRVSMTIRMANVEDAAALDHFFQQLDRETCFMLYEAGEQGIELLYSNPKEQRR